MSGASFLIGIPFLASASFFVDMLQKTASNSSASDASYNSQTVPLLDPAVNIDPSPAPTARSITLVHGEALMAQDNPLSPGDTQTQITNPQISVYTVRDGDTLSGIAAMFDVSINTIVGANDIQNGVIHPGQELIILPITGIEHTVVKGETLASLADKYHSDAHDIATYNSLPDDAALTVGSTIIIPSGEVGTQTETITPNTQPPKKPSPSKPKSKSKSITKTKGFKPAPLRDAGGPEYDGYYDWPLDGGIITQTLHGYNAVDIGAPTGTTIYAAAAGTVIIAKDNDAWNGGYGNYVVIAHDNGTQTLYAHMSKVLTSEGQTVAQDQVIGRVGRTGEATGPHLHFEVRGATNPFGAIPVGSGE